MQLLSGLRVLELGDGVAAGYAGKLLADLGATVLKPTSSTKQSVPPALGRYHEVLSKFLDLGKTRIDPAGTLAHVTEADVLITTAVLDALRANKLDPDEIASRGKVMISITSFGLREENPSELMPDLLASALGGFVLLTGDLQHTPARSQASLPQFQAAIAGVIGGLAAMLSAEDGHGGEVVDVSLYESTAFLMEREDIVYTHQGQVWKRTPRHMVVHPFTILPCRDGYVALAVAGPQMFQSMCELIGQPEMADDLELVMDRVRYADQIDAVLLPWLAEHDRAEVAELMQERRIPVTPVLDFREVLEDAHMQSREFFREVDVGQPVVAPRLPYRFHGGGN